MIRHNWLPAAILTSVLFTASAAPADEPKGEERATTAMTYREAKEFLAKHTKVVELTDGKGAGVIICPEYCGRVMTSTCNGEAGRSLGWFHRSYIEAGKHDPHFNNFGGEDRLWLAPEGGQFSLWFKHDEKQELANWFTPPAFDDGAFEAVSAPTDPVYRLKRQMKLTNAANTEFQLDASRDIRLLDADAFGKLFGAEAQAALGDGKLKLVGYESANTITNRGAALKKETGLVSIWILGMFMPGPETVIIIPYRGGDEAELGPVVKDDYFGKVPAERLHITPEAILFRGDGQNRGKIGTSQRRAKPVAGSIDYQAGVLTLVSFDLPEKPTEQLYLNNAWSLPQEKPFVGDPFNSYNDGPPGPGKPPLGPFYEIETLSPAAELAAGASLTHHHRTFHIGGDLPALARLAKATLGVDLDAVKKEALGDTK